MPISEPPALGTAMLPRDTFAAEVVVVTGGGTGLGKAIAVEFGRVGAAVAIVSRSADHRARGVEAVETTGARAIGVEMDVREPEQIATAFDTVEAQLGPIGVLVNNAAGNFPVAAEDLSPKGWRSVTDIVLNGTFNCSHALAVRRIADARPAAILNIGATYAWTGGPGAAHSAAAKAGVVNMTMTLAVEWAPYGIRVNCLCPGLFPHDDMPAHMTANRPEGYAEAGKTIPAGRVGRPHELGWAATYLCSPFASYVTGETLVVDGANWQRRGLKMPVVVPVKDQVPRRPGK